MPRCRCGHTFLDGADLRDHLIEAHQGERTLGGLDAVTSFSTVHATA